MDRVLGLATPWPQQQAIRVLGCSAYGTIGMATAPLCIQQQRCSSKGSSSCAILALTAPCPRLAAPHPTPLPLRTPCISLPTLHLSLITPASPKVHLGDTPHSLSEADYQVLGQRTEGFSGSDVSVVVKDVLMQPIRLIREATHFRCARQGAAAGVVAYARCLGLST